MADGNLIERIFGEGRAREGRAQLLIAGNGQVIFLELLLGGAHTEHGFVGKLGFRELSGVGLEGFNGVGVLTQVIERAGVRVHRQVDLGLEFGLFTKDLDELREEVDGVGVIPRNEAAHTALIKRLG